MIESIDGVASQSSPFARVLLANGARIDYRGMILRAPIPGVTNPVALDEPDEDDGTD
jgi:hypothetical protein